MPIAPIPHARPAPSAQDGKKISPRTLSRRAQRRASVLAAVESGHSTGAAIAEATSLSRKIVYEHLARLEQLGKVYRQPKSVKPEAAGKHCLWLPFVPRAIWREALAERGQVNVTARSIEIADYLREVG